MISHGRLFTASCSGQHRLASATFKRFADPRYRGRRCSRVVVENGFVRSDSTRYHLLASVEGAPGQRRNRRHNNNWFAAWAFWQLKIYGHAEVRLLSGGRKKWLAGGLNASTRIDRLSGRSRGIQGLGGQADSAGAVLAAGREKYDFVVVLLPTNDTHGHHKTVALMTLEVIADLNPTDRPITLGVRTISGEATFDLDLRPKNADELSCRARLQRCRKLGDRGTQVAGSVSNGNQIEGPTNASGYST